MALKRDMGTFSQLFTAIAAIIGSGWLFAPYYAAQVAGPASIVSWGIGTVLIMFVALCFAEVITRFPISGGIVRIAYFAYGYPVGCMASWLNWLSFVITPTIEARATVQYVAHFFPTLMVNVGGGDHLSWLGILAGIILLLLFVIFNWLGIKLVSRINGVLVCWKLIVPIFVIIVFFIMRFHSGNFYHQQFMPFGWNGVLQGLATGGVIFSLTGFRTIIELAGEAKNPRKGLPFALIGSILICAAVYIALQIAFIGVINPKDIINGWQHLNFAGDYGPLISIAGFFGLVWLVGLLLIDAIISPADTGLVFVASTSRIVYAMSKARYVPKFFSKTNRMNVPVFALTVNFIIGAILFLPFPNWQSIMEVFVALAITSYALGPLTLGAFRRKLDKNPNVFHLPCGFIIALIAFYVSNLVVIWSGWPSVLTACIILTILILFVLSRMVYFKIQKVQHYFKEEFKVLAWMIVYVICLLSTSLLSGYGNHSLHLLSLYWDFIIVAIFSLIIFFWAIFTCLSAERMEANIQKMTAGEL